jgi:hypothetical protein
MSMNTLFDYSLGDQVTHETYGPGVVIEEWGSWLTCQHCGSEAITSGECTACGGLPHMVSGHGIFDVLFRDGKMRSINRHWLMPSRDRPPKPFSAVPMLATAK